MPFSFDHPREDIAVFLCLLIVFLGFFRVAEHRVDKDEIVMAFLLFRKDGLLETGIGKGKILRKERSIDGFLSHGNEGIGKGKVVADSKVVPGLGGVSKPAMEKIKEIIGRLVSFLEGKGNLSFRFLFVDSEKGMIVVQEKLGKEKMVESVEGIGLEKDIPDIAVFFGGAERILELMDEVFEELFPC